MTQTKLQILSLICSINKCLINSCVKRRINCLYRCIINKQSLIHSLYKAYLAARNIHKINWLKPEEKFVRNEINRSSVCCVRDGLCRPGSRWGQTSSLYPYVSDIHNHYISSYSEHSLLQLQQLVQPMRYSAVRRMCANRPVPTQKLRNVPIAIKC